jgi:hypothetical protein
MFVGVSSDTNVWASIKVARELEPGKTVVVLLPDGGERYLSSAIIDGGDRIDSWSAADASALHGAGMEEGGEAKGIGEALSQGGRDRFRVFTAPLITNRRNSICPQRISGGASSCKSPPCRQRP